MWIRTQLGQINIYPISLLDYQSHLNVEVCTIYNVCTKLFMAFVLDLTATITITKMNILLEVDSVTCGFFFIG